MTIGVDTTSNSVIVAAPDQLFKEVEDLVKTIDQAGTQTNETLEVRTLHLANPDVVREALSSILGEEVNSSSSGGSSSSSRSSSSGGQSGQATADQIRQRMEFFNRLRSSGAFGSQGGSSGGRPSGFPGSSGGRPGGSPGGAPGVPAVSMAVSLMPQPEPVRARYQACLKLEKTSSQSAKPPAVRRLVAPEYGDGLEAKKFATTLEDRETGEGGRAGGHRNAAALCPQ